MIQSAPAFNIFFANGTIFKLIEAEWRMYVGVLCQHCSKWWLAAWAAPSHHPTKRCLTGTWALENKLQRNLGRDCTSFNQVNVLKMSSAKYWPSCLGLNALRNNYKLINWSHSRTSLIAGQKKHKSQLVSSLLYFIGPRVHSSSPTSWRHKFLHQGFYRDSQKARHMITLNKITTNLFLLVSRLVSLIPRNLCLQKSPLYGHFHLISEFYIALVTIIMTSMLLIQGIAKDIDSRDGKKKKKMMASMPTGTHGSIFDTLP